MSVRIETIKPVRVAFIRHTGPYTAVGPVWGRLCGWAGPRGLMGPGTQMIGLCYDDPRVTPPDKIRYDACLTVGADVQGHGEIGVRELPGGDYAVTEHKGSYEKLGETYLRLMDQWLPASGHAARSEPCMEVYLNSPMNTPMDQLRTEIRVPIQ